MGGWAHGLVVQEIQASAETEWVVVGLVDGVALRFRPELFGVQWHCWSWRRRRRFGEEGIRFHFAELSCSEPCPSVW